MSIVSAARRFGREPTHGVRDRFARAAHATCVVVRALLAATTAVEPDPDRERERETPPAGRFAVAPLVLR